VDSDGTSPLLAAASHGVASVPNGLLKRACADD